MTILLEGQPDPGRVAREERTAALAVVRAKHQGQRVAQLSAEAKDELLEAALVALGIADADGVVRPAETT